MNFRFVMVIILMCLSHAAKSQVFNHCIFIDEPLDRQILIPLRDSLNEFILDRDLSVYHIDSDTFWEPKEIKYSIFEIGFDLMAERRYWSPRIEAFCFRLKENIPMMEELIGMQYLQRFGDTAKNLIPVYRIKWPDLQKYLNDTQIQFFQNVSARYSGNFEYYEVNVRIDTAFIKSINHALINKVVEGKLIIYYPDLKTHLAIETPEQMMEYLGEKDIFRLFPMEDDPYYYIDSIVWTPFRNAVKCYKIKTEACRTIGIAPCYRLTNEPEAIPFFWLRWEDLRTVLDEDDMFMFEKWISCLLKKQH